MHLKIEWQMFQDVIYCYYYFHSFTTLFCCFQQMRWHLNASASCLVFAIDDVITPAGCRGKVSFRFCFRIHQLLAIVDVTGELHIQCKLVSYFDLHYNIPI